MTLTQKIQNRNTKLMLDIINYLQKHNMFYMINIYANGRKYSSDNDENAAIATLESKHGKYYDYGEWNVTEQIEYCNPEILTMTFEGPLYHAYNGYSGYTNAEEDIRKICDKYNLYPEQGYAWSLAVYE